LQSIGDSTEHGDFPGTLTQEAETLIASWTALGEKVSDSGIRKLAIVNAHGGQPQIVDIVAQRLRAECGMLVGRINTFLFGVPENMFSADELAFGYHGGEVETSLMLAIAPHLVDRKSAKNFPTLARALAKKSKAFGAEGAAGFAWQAQDLNPSGATGNALAADSRRGKALLAHLSERLADTLNEMAAFPLSHLKEGTK
jgi:creatinine amidohydrolase